MINKSENKNRQANHLIKEKSPYLLQHAYNPVDWHPWGDAAFDKARADDKPIFLSIGYSTCHWCHVMEKESFENTDVAKLMNETFVCIKVDREERPDIDSAYMAVCQMMTGSGGWPLTIIMMPDKRPFFAGTYIPKESRSSRIGMFDLIGKVKELWQLRRKDVMDSAEKITHALSSASEIQGEEELGETIIKETFERLSQIFDAGHGGFGYAPKFPTPHHLTFLLRYWKRTGDAQALLMVEKTLSAIRLGGIYDHIGFGFHRYSTDSEWFLPHFEKMLYDQALIAMAYIEAYQATGKEEYKKTAQGIFTYVLRDMTDKDGGFYSAEDADSEGEEGRFYQWTTEEIHKTLSKEDAKFIIKVFNLEEEGNFTDEATGIRNGRNILYLKRPLAEMAADFNATEAELKNRIEAARHRLFISRGQRIRPQMDDKILTDWNGLMIAALAKGGRAFNEPEYIEAAKRAAGFILKKMRDANGRLYHRYRDGEVALSGFLDDYAFFIWGLIELYEATFDVSYLKSALEFNNILLNHFWDKNNGGFYLTSDAAEVVLIRKKEIYDGAAPSGNSAAMLNLLRLGRMTGNQELEQKASQISRYFSKTISQAPHGHTFFMSALNLALGPAYEAVIAGSLLRDDTKAMLDALRRQFMPNALILFRPCDEETPEITGIAKFTKDLLCMDNRATAYVCSNYNCKLPTTDVGEMIRLLK
ncbi:MAG: thioredoxin domain-containing protein [Nitrospirota bacterium]